MQTVVVRFRFTLLLMALFLIDYCALACPQVTFPGSGKPLYRAHLTRRETSRAEAGREDNVQQ
jgi:hypothetical protein